MPYVTASSTSEENMCENQTYPCLISLMKLHIFSSVLLEVFCIFVTDLFLSVLNNTNTTSN